MTYFYTNIEQQGNHLLVRGYNNGLQYQHKITFKPKLYRATNKESKYKNIYGNPLEEISFNSISAARNWVSQYKDVANFKFYGMEKWATQYLSDEFSGEIKYDINLVKIVYFDIETRSDVKFSKPSEADSEITSIAMKIGDTMLAFGYGDYNPPKGVKYYKFKDERSLLDAFIEIIQKYKPDIISGWNSELYDIPYIVNRCRIVLGPERTLCLSPWGMINERMIPTSFGKEELSYEIVGIAHLDYLVVYKKLSPHKPENYRLEQVAFDELGERKLDYSEYGSLSTMYKEDHQKFMDYNVKDTALLEKLENKLKFIQLIAMIAYFSRTNYVDVFKNTRIWDSLIYNHLKKKNVVVDASFESDTKSIMGGFVYQPEPGKYGWCVSLDAAALYPSIIQSCNISPDTFVKKLNLDYHTVLETEENPYKQVAYDEDYCVAGNGSVFSREKKGFLVELSEMMTTMRNEYKKKMLEYDRLANDEKDPKKKKEFEDLRDYYDNYQKVIKILNNSMFGALAANGFRYCHSNFSEAITATGQLTIQWVSKYINRYIAKILGEDEVRNYAFYSDTDSVTGDTIIRTSEGSFTIAELFEFIAKEGKSVRIDETNKDYVFKPSVKIETPSFDGNEVVNRPIAHIMKHRVKKRMFRIKVAGKFVEVTEDHSVMVFREGKLIEVKPLDIVKGDKVVVLK